MRRANIISVAVICCLGGSWATSAVTAQEVVFKSSGTKAALIELYSSEGCSSCPPAEEWLNKLKASPGLWKEVFPVAFHVDYWNGLGWPDRFSNAAYTQRQRNYATRLGQESVYTPEFILNGREWHLGWLQGEAVPTNGVATQGELSLNVGEAGKKISARYHVDASGLVQPLKLEVALLGFNLSTEVQRGENSGRKLEHDFVVLGLSSAVLNQKTYQDYFCDGLEIKSATGDAPGAVVAWVTGADGGMAQVAGGWLAAAHP